MMMTTTMTMTTGTMTTDQPPGSRPARERDRRRFSVRSRLIVTIGVLVAGSLIAAGIAMWVVESRRIDQRMRDSVAKEFEEFRTPVAAEAGLEADDRLRAFLSRNLPDQGEILWSFPTTGGPEFIGNADAALADSRAFRKLVASNTERGTITDFTVGGTDYIVGVLPVEQGRDRGALVITQNRSAAQQDLSDLLLTYALIGLLSLMLVLAASSWLAGRLLAPVTRLRQAAQEISAGSLDERIEVTGHDDLTDLQITFNEMLDRLEDAFTTQRQMLDDAGHELRTPLTVLQGHLEVMDRHDPDDVDQTTTLLLDEIDRMSRLVEDLLVLAKARRPDFVRREPTDLVALGDGLVARCGALAERRWDSRLEATGAGDVDAQRLTQAVLQLADNAVRHTGPDDTITIGTASGHDTLEIWVADTGPGVSPQLRADLFDRFSTSGHHDGFGLGLSIVQAIARAHGGSVTLDDPAPDPAAPSGATFRMRIPLRAEAVDDTEGSTS